MLFSVTTWAETQLNSTPHATREGSPLHMSSKFNRLLTRVGYKGEGSPRRSSWEEGPASIAFQPSFPLLFLAFFINIKMFLTFTLVCTKFFQTFEWGSVLRVTLRIWDSRSTCVWRCISRSSRRHSYVLFVSSPSLSPSLSLMSTFCIFILLIFFSGHKRQIVDAAIKGFLIIKALCSMIH